MKKLLICLLLVCSCAFGQADYYSPYDPGAARSDLSNVEAASDLSINSLTLADKVQAAWADILGNVYASGTLTVAGASDLKGDVTFTGKALHSAGTAAAPSISFAGDPNTGFYDDLSNDALRVALNGKLRGVFYGNTYNICSTDADPTADTMVGKLRFSTLNNAAIAGGFGVYAEQDWATSDDSYAVIHVKSGGTEVDGLKVTSAGNLEPAGVVVPGAGTAAAPAYTTVGDTNTGIYFPEADQVGISVGGSVAGHVDSSGNLGLGAWASTNYRLRLHGLPSNVAAMYVYSIPPNVTTNSTNNNINTQLSATRCPIDTGVTDSGYRRALMVDSFISDANFKGTLQNLYGAAIYSGINSGTGTVVNNYGLYLGNLSAAGSITNNWALFQVTAAAKNYFAGNVLIGTTTDDGVNKLQVNGGISAGAGTAAAPAYTTTGDTNTGIYFPAADTIGISVGGAGVATFTSDGMIGIADLSVTTAKIADDAVTADKILETEDVTLNSMTLSKKVAAAWADILGNVYASGSAIVGAGTAAAPAYTTTGDTNTGIYFPAADTIGFAEGGAEAFRVNSAGKVLIATSTDVGPYPLQMVGYQYIRNGGSILDGPAESLRSVLFQTAKSSRWQFRTSNDAESGSNAGSSLEIARFDDSGNYIDKPLQIKRSTGNVLIGTTTDDGVNKLQVNGSMRLVGGAAPGSPTEGSIYFNSTDKHFYGYNGTAWKQLDN